MFLTQPANYMNETRNDIQQIIAIKILKFAKQFSCFSALKHYLIDKLVVEKYPYITSTTTLKYITLILYQKFYLLISNF